MILVLEKARSRRAPNLDWGGLSHPRDLIFCQKILPKTWRMSRHIVTMKLSVTSCPQLWPSEHPNSFHRGIFKLNAKSDADSLLYSLSHFECNGHTVHILTQWCLPSPRTSTVKSSLFMHAHSSPLSLAARLHWCCTNCSHCTNNGGSFSRQTVHTAFEPHLSFPKCYYVMTLDSNMIL